MLLKVTWQAVYEFRNYYRLKIQFLNTFINNVLNTSQSGKNETILS